MKVRQWRAALARNRVFVPGLWLLGFALCAVFALKQRAPGADGLGPYPVGLMAAVLLTSWTRNREFIWRALTVAVVFAVCLAALVHGQVAVMPRAVAFATATCLSSLTLVMMLTAHRRAPALRDERDLGRFLLGIGLGALVNALGYAVVSIISAAPDPWSVAGSAATSFAGSSLFYLPFILRKPDHGRPAGWANRAAAWTALIVVSLIVFTEVFPLGHEFPYLVLPMLAWGAVRLPMMDSLLQLATVTTLATATRSGSGHGPLKPPLESLTSPDLSAFYLEIFLIICMVMTLTLTIVIHARVTMSAELHGEREQLGHVLRGATGLLVLGLNADGTVRRFNDGATAMTGYLAVDVIGRSPAFMMQPLEVAQHARDLGIADTISPDASVAERFLAVVSAMAALPEPTAFEWQLTCQRGETRTCSITFARVRDERGAVTGYIGTGEDITERAHAAEATRQALAAERQAVERLKEVDRVKDMLVSTVSHELRTPITNIIGYLELIAEGSYGEPTPAQTHAVARMELNSNRLLALIDDLLTLSRVTSVGMKIERAPVELTELARVVETLISPRAQAKRQSLRLELPSCEVWVSGAANELERALINLLTNAVKFTPDQGTIGLSLRVEDRCAVIEVSDNGVGIPHDEQSQLFSQFFRSSLSREQEIQGTGLGLSIVRAIVELHHGSVEAWSEPSQGSTFRISLPLLRFAEAGRVPATRGAKRDQLSR